MPSLRATRLRSVALGAILVAFWGAPEPAAAQAEGAQATVLFSSPLIGIMGTTFFVADIAYGADGSPLTPAWAVAQTIGASLELSFATIAFLAATLSDVLVEAMVSFGLAGLLSGAWHLSHAIWSLSQPHPARPEATIVPVVIALPKGGLVAVSGLL